MNNEFGQILDRLRQAQSLLIVTHARPDGDGLGSLRALTLSARAAGKSAAMIVPDPVPERYQFLFPDEKPLPADQFATLADAADTIIVVDTCSAAQLDVLAQPVIERRDKVLVIDHHATAEEIGAVQWLDSTAAAAGVMALEVIEALGWSLEGPVASALTVAITSDTGWLRFSNADARCFRSMARLHEQGIRMDKIYMALFQCDRPQKVRLVARALQSMELHCGDRLATMVIRKSDFEATGALPEETENLVNESLRMCSVDTALLLVESGQVVRVSLRSRDLVDVASVANEFGGGGHARAAGLRATMDIDQLKLKLVEACCKALDVK